MRRALGSLVALALALALGGCGGDDGGGRTATRARSPAPGPDAGLAGRVEASGKLTRLAVVAGGRAAEPVILENCLADQFADYRAAAPPCRPIAHVGVLPELRIAGGQTLELVTGAQAGNVFVRLTAFGDPASRTLLEADAKPRDDRLQRWTVRLPGDVRGATRLEVVVSPPATDSGSATLGLRAVP